MIRLYTQADIARAWGLTPQRIDQLRRSLGRW